MHRTISLKPIHLCRSVPSETAADGSIKRVLRHVPCATSLLLRRELPCERMRIGSPNQYFATRDVTASSSLSPCITSHKVPKLRGQPPLLSTATRPDSMLIEKTRELLRPGCRPWQDEEEKSPDRRRSDTFHLMGIPYQAIPKLNCIRRTTCPKAARYIRSEQRLISKGFDRP